MSGLALGWARKRRDAPNREAKSLLMYLADNANEQMAWPSKGTLAEDVMCSEKTVMRLLQQLVDARLLVRLDVEDKATGRTRTCGYYFPVQGRPPGTKEVAAFEREVGGRVTRVSPWEGDTSVPLEGDTDVTGRVTIVSPHNEPPLEPSGSEDPSAGAGERVALDELVRDLEAQTPARVIAVSDRAAYREALEAMAAEGVDLGLLAGCMARFAASDLFHGRKVPEALERWLSQGKWRGWLAVEGPAAGPVAAAAPVFAGPPGLRAAIVGAKGEAFAGSYLDRCAWDGAALTPATGAAHRALSAFELRPIIQQHGATLCAPTGGTP